MALTSYYPTTVSPPGETLQELLDEKSLTQAALAERLGRSLKHINEVVKGKASITSDLAIDLERVLGTPSRFWLNREAAYRDWLTRESRFSESKLP